jgi:hypothetical protein
MNLINVPLALTAKQLAAFKAVSELAEIDATPAEVVLALACAQVESLPRDGDGMARKLAEPLWKFVAKRSSPA